jgi:hypothetical protein
MNDLGLPMSRTVSDTSYINARSVNCPSELSSHDLSQSPPLSLAPDRPPVRVLRRREGWREGCRLQELEKEVQVENKAGGTRGEWKVLQRTVRELVSLPFVSLSHLHPICIRRVEIQCPAKNRTALILGIVIAVVGGNYIRPFTACRDSQLKSTSNSDLDPPPRHLVFQTSLTEEERERPRRKVQGTR